MPHVALEKLFRSRQVRVCLDAAPAEGSSPGQGQQRMRRIARDATLSPGMQLLIPKAALQPAPEHCQTDTGEQPGLYWSFRQFLELPCCLPCQGVHDGAHMLNEVYLFAPSRNVQQHLRVMWQSDACVTLYTCR